MGQSPRKEGGADAERKRSMFNGRDDVLDKQRIRELSTSMLENEQANGFYMALLLNDMTPATSDEVAQVRGHRWGFRQAEDLALQGRSFCCFIRCLLDLSRNVQLTDEGPALDPPLTRACKTFVSAQCRSGRMGEMYQLLTHFLSNSPVFVEWERFLKVTFEDDRAKQENFLVPHIEQVWMRFCRFRTVLEDIFCLLDTRFVWHHRLPTVNSLVREHMKRRCFSSENVTRNEMFCSEKCSSDTIKKVKHEFGFT
jgi:hypothetical protein